MLALLSPSSIAPNPQMIEETPDTSILYQTVAPFGGGGDIEHYQTFSTLP